MRLDETANQTSKKAPGRGATAVDDVRRAVRAVAPELFRFHDDGSVPNNPHLPMLLFPRAVALGRFADPAAAFEVLFEANGWGDSWRNGIYPFVHYHSRTHEVLGFGRGNARVRFGGGRGREIGVAAGDVVVLPAGTGHQCLETGGDLLVVGAYLPDGTYDECRGTAAEHARALRAIPRVATPEQDPVFGRDGPLRRVWGRR